MAKRKVAEEKTAVLEQDVGYEIGKWAGCVQYACRRCAYDTLDLEQMVAHLTDFHSISGQKPVGTPVAEIPTAGGLEAGELLAADDAATLVAEDAAIFEIDLEEVEDGKN